VGTAREASDDGRIYPTLCPTTRAVNNMQVRLVSEKTIPSSARNHGFARARVDFVLALVSFLFERESLCGFGPARATFGQKGNETRLLSILISLFLSLSLSLSLLPALSERTRHSEWKEKAKQAQSSQSRIISCSQLTEDGFPDPSQSRILLTRIRRLT